MEKQKERLEINQHANKHVIAMVELIWEKLDYYYSLSDMTPAYRAAVLLHPGKKLRWFKTHWASRADWQVAVKEDFEKFAYSYVKSRPPTLKSVPLRSSPRKRKPRTKYQAEDSNSDWGEEAKDLFADKLNCYLNSPVSKRLISSDGIKIKINIIKQWFNRHNEYPILSLIALDLAAAPPESSDLERKFSDALNIFTDKRNGLKPDTVEALMLLKSGLHEGLRLQACNLRQITGLAKNTIKPYQSD